MPLGLCVVDNLLVERPRADVQHISRLIPEIPIYVRHSMVASETLKFVVKKLGMHTKT